MTTILPNLRTGTHAIVREIHGNHGMRSRLLGVGVHPGDTIEVIRSGALGGPVLIGIHGAHVAIGRRQAQRIEVEIPDPA